MPSGKVVLITGVTRGLGRAMADEFARLGHTVLGCGRTALEIDRLRRALSTPHSFQVVDVASDLEVEGWARNVLRTHGPPDLLLNNAAIINQNAPLYSVPARDFDQVIDINIKGVANVIRHFVPAMIEQGRGVIVNSLRLTSDWLFLRCRHGKRGYKATAI